MTTASATAPTLMSSTYKIKEAGFAYMYVSNEHPTLVDVYYDDVKMSYTPGNVIQSNEYYPFGLQTANSWTRDNTTGNNFLGNGGTELNTTSQVYDLQFRNYDPILGRMNQVDPLADKYGSITPYNYANNDPVFWNDASGAEFSNTGSPAPSHWSRDMEEMSSSNKPAAIGGVLNPYQDLWGLVGNYGLAGGGFGFGDEYAKVSRLAMARNDALSSTNGGSIDTGTGKVSFYNSHEVFAAGYAYNEYHNSWSTTVMGSAYASVGNYQTILQLASIDLKMTYAYQGHEDPGPNPLKQPTGHYASDWYNTVLGSSLNFTGIALIGEETLTALKTIKVLNGLGLMVTGYTIYDEERVSTSSSLDGFFGVLAFTPAAPASLLYFGINFGSLMYNGKSLGENIDRNFIIAPSGVPGGFMLIPRNK